MGLILSVRGFTPQIPSNCFIAPNATIVGQVSMGKECSVWFNAVLRGDVSSITLSDRCNIQDGAIIHGTFEKSQTELEFGVSVGHGAILHGCHIQKFTLIGMQAVVMDHAEIGEECLIGAGTLVTAGTIIPKRSLVVGRPGRVVRSITDEELEILHGTTDRYIMYSKWYETIPI